VLLDQPERELARRRAGRASLQLQPQALGRRAGADADRVEALQEGERCPPFLRLDFHFAGASEAISSIGVVRYPSSSSASISIATSARSRSGSVVGPSCSSRCSRNVAEAACWNDSGSSSDVPLRLAPSMSDHESRT
jgi:hypothetical protein